MYAFKWKRKLGILNLEDKVIPQSLIYSNDLNKDMDRTFPTNKFFTPEIKLKIKNILLNYIEVNSAMDYFQGLCYITYALYYVFSKDKTTAEINTFYALHKIIAPIRPCIPLDEDDIGPPAFISNLSKVIILKISEENIHLAEKLNELDIVKIYIVQGMPALFANWYDLESVIHLWDYIIDTTAIKMFDNVIEFFTAYFLSYEKIIMNFQLEKILQLLQSRTNLGKILQRLKYKKYYKNI